MVSDWRGQITCTGWLIKSVTGLGWLWFCLFHCLPDFACADKRLAELAEQLGKRVKHPNESQPNPSPRADGSACRGSSIMYVRFSLEFQRYSMEDELRFGADHYLKKLAERRSFVEKFWGGIKVTCVFMALVSLAKYILPFPKILSNRQHYRVSAQ